VSRRCIVLKFGGSVLGSAADLPRVVSEIYRWRREGYAVVAVVSAFHGTTDRLFAEARAAADDADPHALAEHVARGEHESATLLALALDRSGVAAAVSTPAALRFVAQGPALEATPKSLERAALERVLARGLVAVVPGYAAIDELGRMVLLGRGGSDLSALFLARELGARCRLLKDTEGVFERDPALDPRARPFAALSFARALAIGGRVLQPQALRCARAGGLAFEVAGIGSSRATKIGACASRVASERSAAPTRPLRIALLGAGAVGGALIEALDARRAELELVAVAVRDTAREREWRERFPRARVLADPRAAATLGAEVVVEALGGIEPAHEALRLALDARAHVVTANKSLVAAHGVALREHARRRDLRFRDGACVGGALPILEQLRLRDRAPVVRVRGVLNGTSNFVLERLARGVALREALEDARTRGYAERDATRDLDGRDAAEKLVCIAQHLGWRELRAEQVERAAFVASSTRHHQVAELDLRGERARARVRCEVLSSEDPLRELAGARNAVELWRADGARELLCGRGAGGPPTAEALLGDLLELHRAREVRADGRFGTLRAALGVA
jgi:homoserine dehydrogenase